MTSVVDLYLTIINFFSLGCSEPSILDIPTPPNPQVITKTQNRSILKCVRKLSKIIIALTPILVKTSMYAGI